MSDRQTRKTSGAEAYGKSVWSWHPLLVSSRRRCVGPTGRGHVVNSPMTVARRIRRRGERVISCKTIAWGMPDVSGASAVNTRVHTYSPQRTRGCGCIGHPAFPAPSVCKGRKISGKARAQRVASARRCVWIHRHCEEHLRRSNPCILDVARWIASLRSQ